MMGLLKFGNCSAENSRSCWNFWTDTDKTKGNLAEGDEEVYGRRVGFLYGGVLRALLLMLVQELVIRGQDCR
jgi:hypothetical protein